MTPMRTCIALIGFAAATLALGSSALALSNPLVADVVPLGGGNVHGNATFFQLGDNVTIGLNLSGGDANQEAIDVPKGTCKSYASTAQWPLGAGQNIRLPHTKLNQLLGDVLLVHKTPSESSPVVGCAAIKD
jgi:hypothetical protein